MPWGGERLAASAEQYGVIEIGIVDGFGTIGRALPKGNFGKVGPLDAATPTVDAAASAQKLGESVGDFQNAQSPPQVSVAGVSVKRDVDQLLRHPMQGLKTQSLLVRTGARALGVNRALRFLGPVSMLVRGATRSSGTTPGMTALDSGTELATDTAVQEAGEEATGENQRNEDNREAMDRGFA